MSIQSEIDAVVGAFVEDLAELVRRAALEEIRRALGTPNPPAAAAWNARPERRRAAPKSAPASSTRSQWGETPHTPRRAEPPPAEPTPRVVEPQPTAPLPLRRRLDPQRRGRLIVMPSTSSQPPSAPRFEAPVTAVTMGAGVAPPQPKAPSNPPPPESESTPAKKWVVVRRPARAAANGGAPDSTRTSVDQHDSESAARSPTDDAPPPASVEPPTQPVPQPAAAGGESA